MTAVDGGSAHRIGAFGRRGGRYPQVGQQASPPGPLAHTPTPIETAVSESRPPVEDGMLSETGDAAGNTELAVSSEAEPTGAFLVEAVAG